MGRLRGTEEGEEPGEQRKVTAEAERNMLAGDVPKCSLEERAALDERLEYA